MTMNSPNVTWANLFPATTQTKPPAPAKKIDGDKYANNEDFFAVRVGRGMLDLGVRIGRKVGLAHLNVPEHRSDNPPDFVGNLI